MITTIKHTNGMHITSDTLSDALEHIVDTPKQKHSSHVIALEAISLNVPAEQL